MFTNSSFREHDADQPQSGLFDTGRDPNALAIGEDTLLLFRR